MKRLLLAPLLIYISLLNMGFMGKPKLEALYCDQEKYMKASIEEMWENFPWIYDNKNGKLYKYDSFLITFLNRNHPLSILLLHHQEVQHP